MPVGRAVGSCYLGWENTWVGRHLEGMVEEVRASVSGFATGTVGGVPTGTVTLSDNETGRSLSRLPLLGLG